jgi:hypothetical protein
MRCSIDEEPWSGWCRDPSLGASFRKYLRRQLYRRGFRSWARLDEAQEVALQHLATDLLLQEAAPLGWCGWRRVLDRAVYQAERELRPCGSGFTVLDCLPVPARNPSDSDVDDREQTPSVIDCVERLPAPKRLIAKLKWADVFFPAGEVTWRSDEASYLVTLHDGRPLEELNAEFHQRLARTSRRRQLSRIPSTVIAWLLRRASGDAVDTAFRAIKMQLRNAAPPGAARVSNASARWAQPTIAAPLRSLSLPAPSARPRSFARRAA